MTEYQKTGQQIPIELPELIDYMNTQLDEYDSMTDDQKQLFKNPYTDKIIYTTKNGKTIMIPVEIQNDVISKRQNTSHNINKNNNNITVMNDDECPDKNNSFYMFVIIMLFILAIYYLFKK